MIKFENGKHLTNYILKIFRNDNIEIPNKDVLHIKQLKTVYDFISNLPSNIKKQHGFII